MTKTEGSGIGMEASSASQTVQYNYNGCIEKEQSLRYVIFDVGDKTHGA